MILCPARDLLDAFLDEKLQPPQHNDVESHIETCVECQETLDARCESQDTIATLNRTARSQQGREHWYLDRIERLAQALRQAEANDDVKAARNLETMKSLPTLNGYDIEKILGRGGMGIVLKARHQRMQRDVAIKVLPEHDFRQPSFIDRFYREAQAVARLAHPNIVSAYDAGEQDGIHYLVMEYIDGHDLEEILKRLGPLAVADAVECVIQVAEGLAYAHDRGIIHRDIKPANLLLQRDGVVKILDMGLARMSELGLEGTDANTQFTLAGQIMGTVDFMAPEQALDTQSADARADVYSLGCTLFRLLTGESPFPGDTVMKKILSHREDAIPKLSEKCPEVPIAIDAIFRKMMAKNPDQRYESMNELIADFRTVCDQQESLGVPNLVGLTEQADTIGATQVDDLSESYAETQACAGSVSTLTENHSFSLIDRPKVDPEASENVDRSLLTDSAGSDYFNPWPWIVASVGGFSLFLAAILMFIETPHGVLRIEIDDPSIEVSVGGDDRLRVTGDHGEFEIAPGAHHLQVKVGDVNFQTDQFTLGQGETIALRITMVENQKIQIIRNGTPIEEHLISPSSGSSSDSDALAASKLSSQDIRHSQDLNPDREPIPVLTDGYPGVHALRFNKRNESYVKVPSLTASVVWKRIEASVAFTLELWIQRDRQEMDVHETYIGINHWSITSGSGAGYIENGEMGGRGAPPIRFRGIHGPLWHQEQASHWMHVAAVDEIDKQRRLYLNGKLIGTEPSTLDWGAGGGGKWDVTVRLGGNMVGAIGEARISTIARYQDDFSAQFKMESDEHTLALYHVDKGSGNVLHDSSGNEHHGIIVNAEWVNVSAP